MTAGYSAAQIRAAEAPLIAAGVPLMQRAAAGLAGVIGELLESRPGAILVLAGSGDNGADALYAAATLGGAGAEVRIVRTGSRIHEAAFSAATDAGGVLVDIAVAAVVARASAIVVDGVLGTGTSADPSLRGDARSVVEALLPVVTADDAPIVVAVDIPSGIDPTDGRVPDAVVLPAAVTVTFGAVKAGLLLEPAASLAGEVRLIDIGLAPALAGVDPVVVLP
ncbi:NAD(P)H-hydrate epimerase [Glaciibacter flavus]|uniref:NAD(P)H-hydrate epimerase n=2 Tax=Orlajensenia flava TaxID=2565934 RepID=A0A4S4FZT4_9MICO|nr:NAD(P)H-hydrate epimerase [Glaciibacter flavus]